MVAIPVTPVVQRARWFVEGPEDRKPRRDRHYFAVKGCVSFAVVGVLLLPPGAQHLALPMCAAANLLWIWIDP